ncbi:class I SAM-dependent methyltransferase [Brachyspira hampsonii]|uniref:Class I SAM-dependent methyltransferase n=1 Tax=Brachyspira hampsonii 30446 TaxID=1289135 RepID=A0A2U4EYA7_9SPIR|nr:class I SAM-dependent methyltransferase [Brachyspira hampsonii]EKV56382.1 hypothetical protein A966_10732 [Brachyspira hampsonii 30446]MBW5389461.1 class I SAM-dependent methyltransferase [Brachyspira hampsonii]MBW5394654.1 class I SAM-dependent methyltransferase [Brachyspira hampsonii]OEJ20138.1 hypothetical protein A9495_00125 [Brachyspira hampsonii]
MIISKPETYEDNMVDNINYILDETSASINSHYGKAPASEMTIMHRKFLNGIIRQNKPKKILELGVSAGGSSAIILNAINDIDNSFLYSIDYSDKYYRNPSKEVGWIVKEKFNNMTNKWKLYTGATAAKFIEEIGYDIDICLLDTMHINPGEFIDLLIILPYMKKGGIIILHDTSMHIYPGLEHVYTNGVLFSCLKGKKFNISESTIKDVGNIGAVILDENIMEYVFDYFYLLTLPWQYLPKLKDIVDIENIFSKHYKSHLVKLFSNISSYYYDMLEKGEVKNDKIEYLDNKINRLVNSIAWWIPIRKWRDNFRNKI